VYIIVFSLTVDADQMSIHAFTLLFSIIIPLFNDGKEVRVTMEVALLANKIPCHLTSYVVPVCTSNIASDLKTMLFSVESVIRFL